MSATMRAKLQLTEVKRYTTSEQWTFAAVSKNTAYPADGTDEDNTFATFSPTAELKMTCTNPALLGKFNPGEKYYVDFTPAE